MRGRLVAAGIAGNGVVTPSTCWKTPWTPQKHPPAITATSETAARLLVDRRRRHDARLFSRRSRGEEGGPGEEPNEDERRERRTSFER